MDVAILIASFRPAIIRVGWAAWPSGTWLVDLGLG